MADAIYMTVMRPGFRVCNLFTSSVTDSMFKPDRGVVSETYTKMCLLRNVEHLFLMKIKGYLGPRSDNPVCSTSPPLPSVYALVVYILSCCCRPLL